MRKQYKAILQLKHKSDYVDPDMESKVLVQSLLKVGCWYPTISTRQHLLCAVVPFHKAINYMSAYNKSLKQKLEGHHIVAINSMLNAQCYLAAVCLEPLARVETQ